LYIITNVVAHVGTVQNAHGSAYLELENIKIICSVYKKQSKDIQGQLECDFKIAPFGTLERRGYQKDQMEKDYSHQLIQALSPSICWELYDNTVIQVHCLVLEADGFHAGLAAAITCSSMALCHAGLDLFDIVIGCSAGLSKEIKLDLSEREEQSEESNIVVATMPQLNQVTMIMQTGMTVIEKSLKVLFGSISLLNY
jgi:exosome complex component MTR3